MSDVLSQEEINALMNANNNETANEESSSDNIEDIHDVFDEMQIDAIGEIGNISMGSAATTLFTLLNQKVEITTPRVKLTSISKLADEYPVPFVSVYIKYSVGIDGMNLLILKEHDVKVITSLMMGGDGLTDLPDELTEMHLSAVSEAMNQMMGTTSTSLSEMIGEKIDITPPKVDRVIMEEGKLTPEIVDNNKTMVCTSFRMKVGDIIDSEIMQIIPIDFAKTLVDRVMNPTVEDFRSEIEEEEVQPSKEEEVKKEEPVEKEEREVKMHQEINQPQQQMRPEMQPQYYAPPREQVNVKAAEFSSFDDMAYSNSDIQVPKNMELIKDVMLQITVELGKTVKPINDILDFKPGSILELDKLVGEHLDILANGKKIAKGEVVVIDENYGIRITDILKPQEGILEI